MTRSQSPLSAEHASLLARLDDGTTSIADLNRLLGAHIDRVGGTRPSYEQVRVYVQRARAETRRREDEAAWVDMSRYLVHRRRRRSR